MSAPLLLAALFSLPAAAQGIELVTNGSFTATLAPWVMGGGYSLNPGLESGWDTTGFGVSDSFGVNAGGQALPPPYPPNTLEQQISVSGGVTYEFRCDASGAQPAAPLNNNGDIGTIWVEVNSVEIARFAFGPYFDRQPQRAQLCGRFTAAVGGQVPLRIFFQRLYLAGTVTPRINIDNVSVKDVLGPSFWIASSLQIGTAVQCAVRGIPGAGYATFIATSERNPGVPIPGVAGLLLLDGTAQMMSLSTLDGNGVGTANLIVPSFPWLGLTPFWFQAGMASGPAISLGYHFGVLFTR